MVGVSIATWYKFRPIGALYVRAFSQKGHALPLDYNNRFNLSVVIGFLRPPVLKESYKLHVGNTVIRKMQQFMKHNDVLPKFDP